MFRSQGTQSRLQNPISAASSLRPDACHTNVQASAGSLLGVRQRRPRSTDRHLLALIGDHQVLTSTQLVRLAGMPERTVQYRLGVLYRAGLVSRSRPRAAVGTSPYHVWLTTFGAEAVGAGPAEPWSERPGAVRTVAALSELWLGLRNHGPAAGLTPTEWRRLPDGFAYRDPRTGADRRLAAGAELRVRFAAVELRALVFARVDRIPRARLGAVLARWAAYLTAPASASDACRSNTRRAATPTSSASARSTIPPAPAGSATSQPRTSKLRWNSCTSASSCPPPGPPGPREEMAAEIVERQRADAAQRELLTRRLAKAEAQRRKLLDAYYAGAIDVPTLKIEQARIGADIDAAKYRLGDLDANLGEWQEILELAATLATRCGDAYRMANDRTRRQFNAAVLERLDVKDGRLCHEQHRTPFDDIFTVSEFEYETRVACSHGQPTWDDVSSQQGSPRDSSWTFHILCSGKACSVTWALRTSV